MALDKDLLAKVKAGLKKQAFVPAGGDPAAAGGMPPGGDPAAAGGMPVDPSTGMPIDPSTGMPMDPSMMGGAPMDPSMMGGAPMDPSMMGGMPPGGDPASGAPMPAPGGEEMSPDGEPYIKLTFSQLLAAFDKISKLAQKISAGGGQPAAAPAQPAQQQDPGNQALVDEVKDLKNVIMSAFGR